MAEHENLKKCEICMQVKHCESNNSAQNGSDFVCKECWNFPDKKNNDGNPQENDLSRLNVSFSIGVATSQSDDDTLKQSDEQMNMICKAHRSEHIHLYCAKCLDTICSKCEIEKHRGHEISDLQIAAAGFSTAIAKLEQNGELEKKMYIAEIEKLQKSLSLCADKHQEITNIATSYRAKLKSMLDTLTENYEENQSKLKDNIQNMAIKRFENEIKKYETNLNKLNDRINLGSLMLSSKSSITDKANLVKQIETEPLIFEESQLLKETIADCIEAAGFFAKSNSLEMTKSDISLTQLNLLSLDETIDLQLLQSSDTLPIFSMSVFAGQLLFTNGTLFILTDKFEKRVNNILKAVWCSKYIATVGSKSPSKVRLCSQQGRRRTTIEESFADLKKIHYNLRGELFIITSDAIVVVNFSSEDCSKYFTKKILNLVYFEDDSSIVNAIEVSTKLSSMNDYKMWVIEQRESDFSMAIYTVHNAKVFRHDVSSSSCPLFQNNNLYFADLVFDGEEKVLISDKVNNAIFIFSSDGTYERQFLTLESQITNPISLTYDISNSQLYVLLEKGVIKKFTLKKQEQKKVCYTLKITL